MYINTTSIATVVTAINDCADCGSFGSGHKRKKTIGDYQNTIVQIALRVLGRSIFSISF
jgi:hypothetical protein